MRKLKHSIAAASAGLMLATSAATSKADFLLQSESLSLDKQTQTADFTLTFNQPPDFQTLDSNGNPVNSFQINFNGNYQPGSSVPFLNTVTGVVRGDEIHVADNLRIRSGTGDGGPGSGGWGPVVDSVPFSLIGSTVSFSVPNSDLGYTGKKYQYEIFSLADGTATTDHFVTAVPTPRAFASGLAGLVIVAGASMVMRRKSLQRAN